MLVVFCVYACLFNIFTLVWSDQSSNGTLKDDPNTRQVVCRPTLLESQGPSRLDCINAIMSMPQDPAQIAGSPTQRTIFSTMSGKCKLIISLANGEPREYTSWMFLYIVAMQVVTGCAQRDSDRIYPGSAVTGPNGRIYIHLHKDSGIGETEDGTNVTSVPPAIGLNVVSQTL